MLKFGSKDTVNTFMISPFGDDFNVPKGYDALYIKTSNSSEPVCVGFINKIISDDLASGEKIIFSTDESGDNLKAFIKLLNTGIIHFNGDGDFIAGFNDLKSGFDQLKSDVNNLVTGFNSHTHLTVASLGTPTPPVPVPPYIPASPSTASIDSSKKDNLKTE